MKIVLSDLWHVGKTLIREKREAFNIHLTEQNTRQ